MNKQKFLLLFFLLFVNILNAQSLLPSGDRFQVSLSSGNIQYKDFLYNGLLNNGVNISLGAGYSFEKNSLNHDIGLNIDAAALWNRYNWDNYCFRPALHYRLITPVSSHLKLGSTISYSSLYYLNEYFDSHHTYWLTNMNIGISGCLNFPVNNRSVILIPFNLPLFGFISRPAANRNLILNEPDLRFSDILKRVNSNFKWVFIGNKFIETEAGLLLRTRLSSNRQLTFGYQFHYLHTATSLNSQYMTNQFVILFPFKK